MKQTFTKLGGALFALLFLVTSSAQATITATWDFKTKTPSGIENVSIQGNTGNVASNLSGVSLFVDATSGKFAASYSGETYREYCQVNVGTIVHIPVVSTHDVIILNNYYVGADYTLGGENNATSHTATASEVNKGYVVLTVTSGAGSLYITSITATLDYFPATPRQATWDFTGHSSVATTIVGLSETSTDETITVNGLNMVVNANGKRIGDNTNSIWSYPGLTFHVPVISTEDIVTVNGFSGYCEYTINDGATITDATTNYVATAEDVTRGYVKVVNGVTTYKYICSISVTQKSSTTATIGSTGWATFSNPFATDFTSTDGVVDAYEVTGNSGSAITKKAVTTAAAETGLLLNAAAGTYAIPLVASGTDLSATNKLKAVLTGETVSAAASGFTNFVLAGGSGTAVFKSVTGNNTANVGAGKAYLQLAGSSFAPQLFFDRNVTGIGAVKSINKEDGAYYNLAGQRVAQPQKGLYIVNGKKVIIK